MSARNPLYNLVNSTSVSHGLLFRKIGRKISSSFHHIFNIDSVMKKQPLCLIRLTWVCNYNVCRQWWFLGGSAFLIKIVLEFWMGPPPSQFCLHWSCFWKSFRCPSVNIFKLECQCLLRNCVKVLQNYKNQIWINFQHWAALGYYRYAQITEPD